MNFIPLDNTGIWVIEQERKEDKRGWLMRTYCKEDFLKVGFKGEWVQHNHTITKYKGSIRGMHYQIYPSAEEKLVRCIAGSIVDIVVDLRIESPTFLSYFSIKLSENNNKSIFIPKGFAHGFQTLTDNVQLLYCHSAFYNPLVEAGVRYDDPKINISWPLKPTYISERDQAHPYLDKTFKGIKV